MVDLLDVREALRARLLTLVVATTGSTTLAATSQGFTRTAGSFKNDGFAAGQEVLPAGFTASLNVRKVIESVTDTLVKISGGLTTTAVAAPGRTLTVGPPEAIQWELTQTPYTNAPGVRPYWYEQLLPGTQDSAADTYSLMADNGSYVLTSYGLSNKGVLAMSRERQAIRELFYPGFQIEVGDDDDWLRLSGVQSGQPVMLDNGYVTVQYQIPWRVVSGNAAAA